VVEHHLQRHHQTDYYLMLPFRLLLDYHGQHCLIHPLLLLLQPHR
jgi:hypothetical protein